MKAKVTHPEGFKIFSMGVTHHFPAGTVLEGILAQKAIGAQRANRILDGKKAPKTKATKPPENKSA